MSNDQDNELDKIKSTILDSVSFNRRPISDNELANKIYVDDSIGQRKVLKFNQALQSYLKTSVGNNIYHLTNYDKIQNTHTTIMNYPNTGGYFLQISVLKCNDKNNNGKIQKVIKSTRTKNPTGYSGAQSLPLIGDSFMYDETSSKNQVSNVSSSFERSEVIQISNITFYYNNFSILTNDSFKSMGRFIIHFLLEDNRWSTRYNIPKNDGHSDSSTDWTLLSLSFTEEIYGNKLIYDQVDTAHADMCFSIITRTHSVY